MKKLMLVLSLLVVAVNVDLEARGGGGRGGGGHGGGAGRGGHSWSGGGRSWSGGRGGYYRGGGWGRGGWGGGWGGWGWGPGIGVGLSVPLGGPSYESPQTVVIQQPASTDNNSNQNQDPYYVYLARFGDPVKSKNAYKRWLFSNYPADQAQYWYNIFLVQYYNPAQASKPSASLSIGTGVGFGGGYGRGWW